MVNCEGRFKISLLSTPFRSNNLESQLISCNRNHLPTHHPHPLFKVNLDKRGYSKILNLKDFIHFETLSLSSYSFIKELDIIEVELVFSEHKSKFQQAEQKRNQEKGRLDLKSVGLYLLTFTQWHMGLTFQLFTPPSTTMHRSSLKSLVVALGAAISILYEV